MSKANPKGNFQGEFSVIAGNCPNCGAELDGLSNDRLFTCRNCFLAIDFFQKPVERYPVTVIQPGVLSADPMIYLPIWRFEMSLDLECANPEKLTRYRRTFSGCGCRNQNPCDRLR